MRPRSFGLVLAGPKRPRSISSSQPRRRRQTDNSARKYVSAGARGIRPRRSSAQFAHGQNATRVEAKFGTGSLAQHHINFYSHEWTQRHVHLDAAVCRLARGDQLQCIADKHHPELEQHDCHGDADDFDYQFLSCITAGSELAIRRPTRNDDCVQPFGVSFGLHAS